MIERSDTYVEVYLRERVPPPVSETIETTVERLRALERNGKLAEVSVDSWGLCDAYCTDRDETAAATIEEFEQWADRTRHSLQPAFARREVSSMFCEGSIRRQEVPILSIAVYEGEVLECVAPCSDGERTHTVQDCLDALAGNDDAVSNSDGPIARVGAGQPQ